MKHLDEYRDKEIAQRLISKIHSISNRSIKLMEVCGGHTMAIRKYGIHNLLPSTIELLSGPGCPVCVTNRSFIDEAIEYCKISNTIIATYGDLMRVPGTESNLDKEKAKGADIRIVYSSIEALKLAEEQPKKTIIFLGIGFETTTPSTAVAVIEAKKKKIKNFLVLSAHKLMPPAMSALIGDGTNINGYIGPGHVSTIAGAKIYESLVSKYNISVVISGFEPIDILQSILMLVIQYQKGKPAIEIQYSRAVSYKGNLKAQKIVKTCFQECNASWRGIGIIPNSGLMLNRNYDMFDAEKVIPLKVKEKPEPKACLCGSILKGLNKPTDCKLFAKSCTPENPVGACMVSNEGTCAAFYKYST